MDPIETAPLATTPQERTDSRSDVLRLLDAEIADVHAAIARRGWTDQATVGALAVVLWMCLMILGGTEIRPWVGVLFFAGLWLLWGGGRGVASALRRNGGSRKSGGPRRVVELAPYLGASRPSMALGILFDVIMLTSVITVDSSIPYWLRLSVGAFASFGILGSTFALVVSYVLDKLTMPLGTTNTGVRIVRDLLPITAALQSIIAVWLLWALWRSGTPPPLAEVRLGALLFAARYLAGQLADQAGGSPREEELTGVRRKLLLGDLDDAQARRRVEIVLLGQKLGEHLQGTSGEADQFRRECLAAVEDLLTLGDDVADLERGIASRENGLGDLERRYRLQVEAAKKLRVRGLRMKRAMEWLEALEPTATGSVLLARDAIDEGLEAVDDELKNAEEGIAALRAQGASAEHPATMSTGGGGMSQAAGGITPRNAFQSSSCGELAAHERLEALRLQSPPLVDAVWDLTVRALESEERRKTSIEAKATTLLGAAQLAVTIAGGVVINVVVGHPEFLRGAGDIFRVILYVTFCLGILAGLVAGFLALRAVLVTPSYRSLSSGDVFNRTVLEEADTSNTEAQIERSSVYRRYMVDNLWQMYEQHFAVHETKAKNLRYSQRAVMVLLFAFSVMFGAAALSAVLRSGDAVAHTAAMAQPTRAAVAGTQGSTVPATGSPSMGSSATSPQKPPAASGGRVRTDSND